MRTRGLCGLLLCAGCGGGTTVDRPDGGGGGACSGTYSMPWPGADDPELCLFPWDTGKPALALTECGEIDERCSSAGSEPDFSCLDQDRPASPPDPGAVTLTGYVDVFSSGPSSDGARIQVFRASQLAGAADPDAVTPLASYDVVLDETTVALARACPREREFLNGRCVLPTEDCGGCPKDLDAVAFCWEGTCEDLQRWEIRYAIAGVPTNEFLVIRTVGLDAAGQPQVRGNKWTPMVQYNVYLATDDRACADGEDADCIELGAEPPIYRLHANLLSSQDYMTIPTSVGLTAGVTAGHGVVGGEVHDCRGVRVQHAQVAFSAGRVPRVLAYFNGNPVRTLPRLQQINEGTDPLGLYAGLDIEPGEIAIAAVGVRDGALAEVGRFATTVWADSVTLIRLNGGRPQQ